MPSLTAQNSCLVPVGQQHKLLEIVSARIKHHQPASQFSTAQSWGAWQVVGVESEPATPNPGCRCGHEDRNIA